MLRINQTSLRGFPSTADTLLYEQRNEKSWETISIAENEREENCEIGKAF